MKFLGFILGLGLISLTFSSPLNQPGVVVHDAILTTPEIIKSYGYPAEIHKVQTKDGYILEMHRIPKEGGIPVFLQHGIMDSSAGWVIMGPQSSFAYYLSDLGYDVWLGNSRGNRYSRNHINLDVNSEKFWDFSFHEIGDYDVPPMVDYVIEKTGVKKIHFIGHSLGTTNFFVMCGRFGKHCEKFLSMQALAPIAFTEHVESPVMKSVASHVTESKWIKKFLGVNEFSSNNDLLKLCGQELCKKEAMAQDICNNIIFLLTGYNSEQLNMTMLPSVLEQLPAGTSTKLLVHLAQIVNSGKFRMFDFGWYKNLNRYTTIEPPEFKLSYVNTPVYLYYSMNDWLADKNDVEKLESVLPNIVQTYQVPDQKFNHLDFLLAMNSREMVQDKVVANMKVEEARQK